MKHDFGAEIGAAAMKAAPPVTVGAGLAAGTIDPQWFVIVPTAVYVTVQLAYLLWKWRREWKAKREDQP